MIKVTAMQSDVHFKKKNIRIYTIQETFFSEKKSNL